MLCFAPYCCGLVLFFQPPVASQVSPIPIAPPLSADEAVRIALENNPRLAAVSADVRAARQNVSAAGALSNPQAFFAPSLTGGVGSGTDTEFLFSQPLELNGTRTARRGVAQARLCGNDAAALVEKQSVAYAVRAAYYELVRARAQITLTRDLLQTTEELNRLARRQVELGSRPAVETVQTGIEVTRAKQQVSLAEANGSAREAALNALLNRPQGTSIGVVALPDLATIIIPAPEEAARLALSARAETRINISAGDAAKQEARLARAEGIPDLAPQYRIGGVTRGIQNSGFGVALTLPFLDYGNRRGRVRAAEETARAEDARATATRLQIEQEATQAVAQARGAQAVLQSFAPTEAGGQNLLADAEQLLKASRLGYQEGRTTIIALLEAQRTYRQIQNENINAQIAVALALAELSRATGGAK